VPKDSRSGNAGIETSDRWRIEVRNRDLGVSLAQYETLRKYPVSLVLENLRSAFNVGSIFRTADTARIAEIITCGYTCSPPHPKLEKTALGAQAVVPTWHSKDAVTAVRALQGRSPPVRVFALETTSSSIDLYSIDFSSMCTRQRNVDGLANGSARGDCVADGGVAFVLGNEASGVSPEVLEAVDEVVEIPMHGFKNSLNVSTACGIALFEVLRQLSSAADAVEDLKPGTASVPFMITRAMRQKLALLGHTEHEIRAMKPQEAHDVLKRAEMPRDHPNPAPG
jgi:tRNA G18 (ribose-2'-O)-methylase SpoU